MNVNKNSKIKCLHYLKKKKKTQQQQNTILLSLLLSLYI